MPNELPGINSDLGENHSYGKKPPQGLPDYPKNFPYETSAGCKDGKPDPKPPSAGEGEGAKS